MYKNIVLQKLNYSFSALFSEIQEKRYFYLQQKHEKLKEICGIISFYQKYSTNLPVKRLLDYITLSIKTFQIKAS